MHDTYLPDCEISKMAFHAGSSKQVSNEPAMLSICTQHLIPMKKIAYVNQQGRADLLIHQGDFHFKYPLVPFDNGMGFSEFFSSLFYSESKALG